MIVLEPADHTFATIVGHRATIQYLSHACDEHVLPHALLVSGPAGIGKASLTYALIKRLVCTEGAPPACPCHACRKVRARTTPDILFIEPKSASGQLTLAGWKPSRDESDDLQYYRFVETPPLEFPRKILVLRQAERMNVALANYLLKLIEEPPSFLTIVLLARYPAELLPTIRSRCAPLSLPPVPAPDMELFAERVAPQLDPLVRRMLIVLSEGRPGRFLELLRHDAHGYHVALARAMNQFRAHGFLALFGVAWRLASLQGSDEADAADRLRTLLDALLAWLRDAALCHVVDREKATAACLHRDVFPELLEFAQNSDLEALLQASDHVRNFYRYVPRQTDRTYVLEMLLSRIGRTLRAR